MAIVQALKRAGLEGAKKLRAASWTICTLLTLGAWGQYTGWDWSALAMAAVVVLGGGAAYIAHATRESARGAAPDTG